MVMSSLISTIGILLSIRAVSALPTPQAPNQAAGYVASQQSIISAAAPLATLGSASEITIAAYPQSTATGALPNTAAAAAGVPVQTPNAASNGLYRASYCGSNASTLEASLEILWYTLTPVAKDAANTSSVPFQAYFKSTSESHSVIQILNYITAGTALSVRPSSAPTSPHFVNVAKPGQIMIGRGGALTDVYSLCATTASGPAVYFPNTQYIFLCPLFWEFPIFPTSDTCPTVNTMTNQFSGSVADLAYYQIYILLHELARFYIYVTTGYLQDTSDWNECIAIGTGKALYNAPSYQLYAASVMAGCQDFPNASGMIAGSLPAPVNDPLSQGLQSGDTLYFDGTQVVPFPSTDTNATS